MNIKNFNLPEVIEKDESEIKQIIALIHASELADDVKNFVIKCIELSLWLPMYLKNKAMSLHRLRTIIFGKGYNKKDKEPLLDVSHSGVSNASDSTQPVSVGNDRSNQEVKDSVPDTNIGDLLEEATSLPCLHSNGND